MGHPDKFSDWTDVLNEASNWATELGAAVVFNVTGGRTPCKIGPFLGLRPLPESVKLSLLSVGSAPFSMTLMTRGPEGRFDEAALAITERAGLEDYLQSYGYVEVDRQSREEQQASMQTHAWIAERTLTCYQASPQPRLAREALAKLYAAVTQRRLGRSHPNAPWLQFTVPLPGEAAMLFIGNEFFDGLPGANLAPGGQLSVTEEFAQKFLGGAWLESLIFSRISAALEGMNDVELAAGLRLSVKSSRHGRPRDVTEFDLLVLRGDRLNLVEAKAVLSPAGLHEAIMKLAHNRNQIAGQTGRAWLVAPFLDEGPLREADMFSHAKRDGVEILWGVDAVDKLVGQVLNG